MAGISSRALKPQYYLNRKKFNGGSELQNQEFKDLTGIELYSTNYRLYDPQIGRFWQVDPLADISESSSSYTFASNNPALINDPFGLFDSIPIKTLPIIEIRTVKKKSSNASAYIPPFLRDERSYSDNTTVYHSMAGVMKVSKESFLPASLANLGFKEPPYAQGTFVREFRTTHNEIYVRVSNSGKGNAPGQWLVKASSIRGMTPQQIQENLALPEIPDQIGEVKVPAGTLMRQGFVGRNNFGPGNIKITQYQLMENIPNSNFYEPAPILTPRPAEPIEVPMEPIEPVEPIIETETPFVP